MFSYFFIFFLVFFFFLLFFFFYLIFLFFFFFFFFFFQAEDGIRDKLVTGVQTCALPIYPRLRRQRGDFLYQLGAGGFLEFAPLLDRNHEGARPADDAILVIDIERVDIHAGTDRILQHDRQAIDDDAFGQDFIAHDRDRWAVVVGAVAGNIDHAPDAFVAAVLELTGGELQRA